MVIIAKNYAILRELFFVFKIFYCPHMVKNRNDKIKVLTELTGDTRSLVACPRP